MIVVELLREDGSQINALVMIPEQIDRFIRLPGQAIRFTSIEAAVVAIGFDEMFPGMTPAGHGTFRVLRDSDIEIEEEAHDLVVMFESALKRRRLGRIIRLTFSADTPQRLRDFVIRETGASSADVAVLDGMAGLADTRQLITPERPDLLFPPLSRAFPSVSVTLAAIAWPQFGRRTSSFTTLTNRLMWLCSSCGRRRTIPASLPSSRRSTGHPSTRRLSRLWSMPLKPANR